MLSILETAGIRFSTARCARYGMDHFVAMLTEMSRFGITPEAAAAELADRGDMPSGKWFRDMVKTISSESVEAVCNMLIQHTAELAVKSGMGKSPILVAIDKHLIPRYDVNNMLHLIYSKAKAGTSKFETYASIQAVGGTINAILDCVPLTRDDEDVDFVRRFVQKLRRYGLTARLILMDREFYSVDVISAVCESGNRFLMPAVKNSGIKRIIAEYHEGKTDAVSAYTMKNSAGREASFTLIIRKSRHWDDAESRIADRYVVFATNLSVADAVKEIETLPDDYKLRWGIETGYRQIEQVRPKTYSRNNLFRNLMFYVSLYIHNMWAVVRSGVKAPKKLTLRMVINATAHMALLDVVCAGVPYDPGGFG